MRGDEEDEGEVGEEEDSWREFKSSKSSQRALDFLHDAHACRDRERFEDPGVKGLEEDPAERFIVELFWTKQPGR